MELVLTSLRLALHHHGCRLEDGHRDLSHGQLLVVGLLGRDDRSIGREHEVYARVRHQVRLELRDVHVQGSIEAKAGRQGTDDLGDQAVQVGVRGRSMSRFLRCTHTENSCVLCCFHSLRLPFSSLR